MLLLRIVLCACLVLMESCGGLPSESTPLTLKQQIESSRIIKFLSEQYSDVGLVQILNSIPVVLITKSYAVMRSKNENILGFNHEGDYIALLDTLSPWLFCHTLTHEYLHTVLESTVGDSDHNHKQFPWALPNECCKNVEAQ